MFMLCMMLLSSIPALQAMAEKESAEYTYMIKANSQRIFSLREARRAQKKIEKRLCVDKTYATTMDHTCKDVVAFVKKYPTTPEYLDTYIKGYLKDFHQNLSTLEHEEVGQEAKKQLADYIKQLSSKESSSSSTPRTPLLLMPCAQCKGKMLMNTIPANTVPMQLDLPEQTSLQRTTSSAASPATLDDSDMKLAILV